MQEFRCWVAQQGFFAGPVFFLRSAAADRAEGTADIQTELFRLRDAVNILKQDLMRNRFSGKNAEIQDTVLSILNDPAFIGGTEEKIRSLSLSASAAAARTAEELANALDRVGSEYIRSRKDDIRGTAAQLAAVLEGDHAAPDTLSAVCATEISPAQLAGMDEAVMGALLTEKGSPASHASILAGNRGIPYFYGNGDAVAAAERAEYIIMDSEKGTVVTDPDEKTLEAAKRKMEDIIRKHKDRERAEEDPRGALCKTKVYANIEGPKDLEALLRSGADGVGLFRTEFLFLNRQTAPSEEEQYEAFRAVLEAMGDREVIIRTMDVGSDKKAPCLQLPDESNPALGLRGIRVSLIKKELFSVQLRALLRSAAFGNLKVMFPMITSAGEIDELRACVMETAQQLEKEGISYRLPPLGIMVETPSAALLAEELAEKVSFFSIGTNDLTQYTLALDREARGLDRFYDPRSEAVFRLIGMTAQGGHRHGVSIGVCGQLAADPEALKRLIALGVDELSVPVSRVRAVKKLAAEAEKTLETEKTAPDPGVAAVADGELIPMPEIPDPVFSGGTVGECFGILPSNGNIYSPVTGTVTAVAETGHAVTVRSDAGTEFLIHAGIGTVALGGKPFVHHVKPGDHVLRDQLIMEADLDMIREAGLSTMVVVVKI